MKKIIYLTILLFILFTLLLFNFLLSKKDSNNSSLKTSNVQEQLDPLKANFDLNSHIMAILKRELDPNLTLGKKRQNIVNEQIKNADPDKLLELLMSYDKDKAFSVRQSALSYEVRLANLQPIIEIRQKVAERLVTALIEPVSNVHPHPYKWLLTFKKEDFNKITKEMLHNALAEKNPDGTVIMICGFADMKEELPRLKGLLIDEIEYSKGPYVIAQPWHDTTGWSARLARARMGVQEDITKCIELAESEQNPNERVERILPQIGYIRQPEAIEYLESYLGSDGRLPPLTPNSLGRPYSYEVLEILAESLENFPVIDKEKDIEFYRKWMAEQENWQIIR